MEDNSGLSENLKKIIDDAFEKRRIAERKVAYRKKRADNELLRTRILSVLPIGKGKRGLRCYEIANQINNKFFDYRNILKRKLREKVSQMLQVLKQRKPRQVQERNGYWKRVIPKSKPIA